MTLRALLKHATTTFLAAVTAFSFAFPADASFRGPHPGFQGHRGHGFYAHRSVGPRFGGPRFFGARHVGPRHFGPRYYGVRHYGPGYYRSGYYGPRYYRHGYYGPRHGYYYHRHRNRAGLAVAAGLIGLTAAVIASQPRHCWTKTRRVYLDSGRRVWRNVRVCR